MRASGLDSLGPSELISGYEYPFSSFVLDGQDVAAYLEATSDDSFDPADGDLVPPLAVAARVLANLSRLTLSPPGTVHSSQEFEFCTSIAPGEQLGLRARVENKLDRGDLHLLTTTFKVVDSRKDIVISGRITVACRAPEAKWWIDPDQA